jgi:hypothetical protein
MSRKNDGSDDDAHAIARLGDGAYGRDQVAVLREAGAEWRAEQLLELGDVAAVARRRREGEAVGASRRRDVGGRPRLRERASEADRSRREGKKDAASGRKTGRTVHPATSFHSFVREAGRRRSPYFSRRGVSVRYP